MERLTRGVQNLAPTFIALWQIPWLATMIR